MRKLIQAYTRRYLVGKTQPVRTAWLKHQPYTLISRWMDIPEIGLQLGYYWVNGEGTVVSQTYWVEAIALFDFGNFNLDSGMNIVGTQSGRFSSTNPNISTQPS
jgi:hypothetical protein